MKPSVHPDLQALAFLVGTWSGEGRGEYPTIEPFAYRETVTFTSTGKPFLAYAQRTFAADDGRPLHAEVGYLRMPRPGWVELVVAHPTGVVEVDEGALSGATLRLRSRVVATTPSAKDVSALERDLVVGPAEIRYRLAMAAVGHDMTHHLEAWLRPEV